MTALGWFETFKIDARTFTAVPTGHTRSKTSSERFIIKIGHFDKVCVKPAAAHMHQLDSERVMRWSYQPTYGNWSMPKVMNLLEHNVTLVQLDRLSSYRSLCRESS